MLINRNFFLPSYGRIQFQKRHMVIAALLQSYLCLMGSMFNRYLNNGKILKAFDLVEIYKLIRIFDTKSFLKVLTAVIISQTFALTVIIGFYGELNAVKVTISVSSFFLAPFLYIAAKRFIGLNVRQMLEKSGIKKD